MREVGRSASAGTVRDISSSGHFDDVVDALTLAISKDAELSAFYSNHPVCLGVNVPLNRGEGFDTPPHFAYWNLEQLVYSSMWDQQSYLSFLGNCGAVFDYSRANLPLLAKIGVAGVFLPVPPLPPRNFFSPTLADRYFDVVFVGARSPRRALVLETLRRYGLRVAELSGLFGEERNRVLQNAKILLNIRYQDGGLLETTRLELGLACGCRIISESPIDLAAIADGIFGCYVDFADYIELPRTVLSVLNEIKRLQHREAPSLMFRYEEKQAQLRQALIDYKNLASHSNRGLSQSASREVDSLDVGFCIDSLLPDIVEAIFRIAGGGGLIDICFEAVIGSDNSELGIAALRRKLVDTASLLVHGNAWLMWRFWLLLSYEAYQTGQFEVEDRLVGLAVADYVSGPVSKAQIAYLANLAPRSRYLFALIGVLLEGMDSTEVCHFGTVRDLVRQVLAQVEKSHSLMLALSQEFSTRCGLHFRLFRHEVAWNVGRSFEAIRIAEEIWWTVAREGSNVGGLADALREFLLRERRFGTDTIAVDMITRFGFAVDAYPMDLAVFQGGERDQNFYGVGALSALMERIYKRIGTPVLGIVGSISEGNRTYLERGRRGRRPVTDPHAGDYAVKITASSEPLEEHPGADFLQGLRALGVEVTSCRQPELAGVELDRLITILATFNEADCVRSVVEDLWRKGSEVVVIDNWSDDGTHEILQALREVGPLRLVRYPEDAPTRVYDWRGILGLKERLALEYQGAWIAHQDTDEIRHSLTDRADLRMMATTIRKMGFNAIEFSVLNFRYIDEGFVEQDNMEEYFCFFEIARTSDLKFQRKMWYQGPEKVDLVSQGGHLVQFRGVKQFPIKAILRHYPLRSTLQAAKKVFADRKSRFSEAERKMGWHSHYDAILSENQIQPFDHRKLLHVRDLQQKMVRLSLA